MRMSPLFALSLLASSSCALHKVELDPQASVPMPAAFDAAPAPAGALLPERWWESFNDPKLDALVAEALGGNFQLRSAWARLEQVDALRVQAGVPRWPGLSFDASVGQSKNRFDLGAIGPAQPGQPAKDTTLFVTNTNYSSSLSASYELDYLRKNDYRARAAAFDAMGARDSLEGAAMSISANVAESYFNLLMQRALQKMLGEQLQTNSTYLELVRLRFQRGEATALDLHQQEGQIAQTRAQAAGVDGQAQLAEKRLAILLGRVSTGYSAPTGDALPELPPVPAAGLPADLLTRRPDLRAAQRALVSADYRLGVSIADRLPSIRLSAAVSLRSTSLDSFFTQPLFNLLAGLTQPIFQAGRLKAETRRNRAVVKEKAANFASTLTQSIFEVESAAIQEHQEALQLKQLRLALKAARGSLEAARQRYEGGLLPSYLQVLTALQATQRSEQALLAAERQRLSYRIQLYRALGGSWSSKLSSPLAEAPNTSSVSSEQKEKGES